MEENIENNTTEVVEDKKKDKKKVDKKSKLLEEKIVALTQTLAMEKEKSMRIQAEMMNFRRRKEKEIVSYKKYCNESILLSLLSIVDNFERALLLENEDNKEFLKGFNMIYSNILNILSENDVKEINSLNQAFDPIYHQAVLTESVDGVEPGVVTCVLQKGYTYKDKVLRPAMVKVSE